VALGGAARETLRLADVLESMIAGLRESLARGDRRQISETKHLDDVVDRLNTSIKTYITSLDADALSETDHRREILAFTTNMEHAGDIVERNLLSIAAKKLKRGLSFSREGEAEILAMVDRLLTNLRMAASLFMTTDERAARLLAAEKEVFAIWSPPPPQLTSNACARDAWRALRRAHCTWTRYVISRTLIHI
jgi:phosphate:Na+ symporter